MTAPLPPPDIAGRIPRLRLLPAGELFHRFHANGRDSIYFDRSRGGRLNAPDGSYGVLNLAATREDAFAETFLRNPAANLVDLAFLLSKAYARIMATRSLRIAHLMGPGLSIMGATAEVTHGGLPYDVPQAWSQALQRHSAGFDGIAYRSRHDDNEVCYALFESSAAAVTEITGGAADLDKPWFWSLANRHGVGLAP